jgi:rhodanese-related sulfurtransferase
MNAMPISAQVVQICAAACALSLGLFALHGLPSATARKPDGDPGACRAPEEPSVADVGVRWISQEEAKALVGDGGVVFLDCRPRPQFEAGHVSGAVHIKPAGSGDAAIADAQVAPLRNARTVITYCDAQAHCARSFQLAQQLRRAGLPDVRVLEDGMPMWIERGYPAESGTCQQCESH